MILLLKDKKKYDFKLEFFLKFEIALSNSFLQLLERDK